MVFFLLFSVFYLTRLMRFFLTNLLFPNYRQYSQTALHGSPNYGPRATSDPRKDDYIVTQAKTICVYIVKSF